MNTGEIISSILSGVAVLLLAAIARFLHGLSSDARRFMAEHMWLLATTLWTRDQVLRIMQHLNMPIQGEPPTDLPKKG